MHGRAHPLNATKSLKPGPQASARAGGCTVDDMVPSQGRAGLGKCHVADVLASSGHGSAARGLDIAAPCLPSLGNDGTALSEGRRLR